MTRVVISPRAQADLDDIAAYLHLHAGSRVAEKYAEKFKANLLRLRDFPGIGAPRPKLGHGVFYEESDMVLVLRVLDGRRNITRKLVGET